MRSSDSRAAFLNDAELDVLASWRIVHPTVLLANLLKVEDSSTE